MRDRWRIRPAGLDDLDACVSLITGYEGGRSGDWRDRFDSYLRDPDGIVYVAVDGGVVAYGRVEPQAGNLMLADPPLPDGYYLSGLVVAESHQRRGLGIEMCRARVELAAARSREVRFFTNARNEGSRALHREVGFQELCEFYSPRLDGQQGVLGHRLTAPAP